MSIDQELILQLTASAGTAFSAAASAEIVRTTTRERKAGRDLLAAVAGFFRRLTAGLTSLLADAWRAAWLFGVTSLPERPQAAPAPKTSPQGQPPPPPGVILREPPTWDGDPLWIPIVEEALADLHAKHAVSRTEWEELSKQAREDAFTVAEAVTADASAHVQKAVGESISQGGTLKEFRTDLAASVETSAIGPAAVENIFSTGAMIAYNVGFEAVRLANDDLFPFVETIPIRDDRLTPLCALISRSGIHGTGIYAAHDPVWRHYRCPRHWRCRCNTVARTAAEAAARGIHKIEFVPWPLAQLPKGWEPGGVGVLL